MNKNNFGRVIGSIFLAILITILGAWIILDHMTSKPVLLIITQADSSSMCEAIFDEKSVKKAIGSKKFNKSTPRLITSQGEYFSVFQNTKEKMIFHISKKQSKRLLYLEVPSEVGGDPWLIPLNNNKSSS